MITNQTLKLFPEPVFKYKFDNPKELNTELSKYIYGLRDKDAAGLKRSNKGGWHSKDFDLRDENSIQRKFTLEIQKYILNSFSMLGWKSENKKIQILRISICLLDHALQFLVHKLHLLVFFLKEWLFRYILF